jgi:predicted ester cyclase
MAAVEQVSGHEARVNVEAVRRVFAALSSGDLTRADEFVAPCYDGGEECERRDLPSPLRGVAGFRKNASWLRRAFSDLNFEEREVIAAGDRVVVHTTMRARHVGRFLLVPPTGSVIAVNQVHLFRLAAGKVTAHEELWGELSLLLQLGAVEERGG